MGNDAFFPKVTDIYFVIKNVSPQRKRITVFNYPIDLNMSRDLLSIPEISESFIRHSLIKGELASKIRSGDIRIVKSNIDLLQFSDEQKAFLQRAGLTEGVSIESEAVVYDDTKSSPRIGSDSIQEAIDYIKANITPTTPIANKLRVGTSGTVDYTTINEAVTAAKAAGASPTNAYEIEIYPGTYVEPPMTIPAGIIISADHAVRMDEVFVVAQNPNDNLFTFTGTGIRYVAGIDDLIKYGNM